MNGLPALPSIKTVKGCELVMVAVIEELKEDVTGYFEIKNYNLFLKKITIEITD